MYPEVAGRPVDDVVTAGVAAQMLRDRPREGDPPSLAAESLGEILEAEELDLGTLFDEGGRE